MPTNCFQTRAWSCDVRLIVDDPRALGRACADLTQLLDRVDRAASRFRADSQLAAANAAAGRPTFVSRLLADLIRCALHAAVLSDGAVDPTVLPDLLALGYDRDIATVRDSEQVGTVRDREHTGDGTRHPRRDWRTVSLNDEIGLLRMPAGVGLDLGATAKAYTADLAARAIATRYGTSALVEIGGDVAVAGRLPTTDGDAGGWVIGVDEMPSGAGDVVSLHRGGIATSTTERRRWTHNGEAVHHIIDPATGRPTDGPWRTASVIAPSCVTANTASTAAIVKGAAAADWLGEHGYAARLVGRDGDVHTTAGWPLPAGTDVCPEALVLA